MMVIMMLTMLIMMLILMQVSRCWAELPQDQYDGLRQKLVDTMTGYQVRTLPPLL